ncbi:MAG TPA: Stp1/IreP family PP2C-type Ser/Thr phosphatase [Coriobacteriia bacterium]|nr:Stp1/IreP family PP2C-type Ser/Thr phosphatase [Coriobacteriia bacterium]
MSDKAYKGVLVGSRTDIGRLRDHNEDSLLAKAPVYVVADGMGGHAAGEVASELAVKAFEEANIEGADENALKRAVAEANAAIYKGALEGAGRAGMGTTLTALVIEEDRGLIAQVGDSRAYVMQDGTLRQATRDHSLMEELVAAGHITEEEALVHPNRSVITRALGLDRFVMPDTYEIRLHVGDRILLCSDGLSTMLDDESIESILQDNPDPQAAADALVEAANIAGGFDNITVIVLNINQIDSRSADKQKRHLIRNTVSFALAFVLLITLAVGGVYVYARNSAFLIEENGYVALYSGIPGEVLGVELKWLEKTTNIYVSALSDTAAHELKTGIQTGSLDKAEQMIREYERQK